MAKTAEFQIVINGLKESISAVETLNAQLDGIEKRLDAISKMSINVNTSKSSRGGSEGLEAEEKLQRQIINAEGLGRVTVKVGDVEREFKSASAATRTLKNELNGLAIEGKRGTKEWEEVKQALTETQTAIQGTSVGMQRLMDTMQSFVAIASVSKGLGALFGVDDAEIQKSIQQLMALQSALNGLDTINKQIANQKGIGYWLSKGNAQIDKFAAGLLKAEKNAKLLASGLKILGAGAIIAGITALVVIFNKFQKSQEEARKAFERNLDVIKTGAEAYRKAEIELNGYIKKLDEFKGSKKAEKQLIDEVSKKYDIHNKNIKDVKDMKALLIKMAPTYLETIREEAKMTALAAESAKLYAENIALIAKRDKLQTDYNNLNWNERMSGYGLALKKQLKDINTEIDANTKSMDVFNKELDKSAGIVAKNKTALSEMGIGGGKETTKTAKEVAKAEDYITKARIDAMKQGLTKTLAQLQLERNRRIEEAKKTGHMVAEQIELINRTYDRKELEARVKHHTDLLNEEKKYAKELASLHADTWQRELDSSQMMYERELQEKINKVTKVVGEGSESDRINALTYSYDALIGHTDSLVKKYAELRTEVYKADTVMKMFAEDSSPLDINGKTIDVWEKQLEDARKKLEDFYKENPAFKDLEDASIIPDIKAAIDVRLQIRRDYYKQLEKYSDEYYKKEKTRIAEEISTETRELEVAEKERHEALAKMFDDTGLIPNKYLKQFKELKEASKDLLKGQSESDVAWYLGGKYMPKFNEWIDSMEKDVKAGKANIDDYIQYTSSELYQSYIKVKNDYDNFMEIYNKASKDQQAQMSKELEEWTDKMNVAYYKYFTAIEEEFTEHENRMKVIQKQGNEQLKKANQESLESQQKNTIAYYSNMATEYERAMSSIRNKMGNRETNDWGIINYTKERQNLKTLQEANTNVMNKIAKDKEELVQKLKDNKITFEDFDAAMDRLNTMGVQAMDMGEQLTQDMKELPGEWWRGIDQWLQQIGQAVSSIIQSLAEVNDAALQNEIDAIDKQTELLQEALDKQKEITQKHADDVNDIEDELASARGDRRQFLIDQLNAEMAAQRESLAQQKRMEKEKEALDKKRDDLEFQQKMNQWNASRLTAMINAALAISAAAVNTYPIPAVPMMALAASVGAAQVAAVMAAKPKRYASGGVLDGGKTKGRSHAQGGIPVYGGYAELEGMEYVVNKRTTVTNEPLLEFINSKKRKLNLDDFIDFYSNNNVKENINRIMPKSKYAEGGLLGLPTLRNDIDINNRLITAIDDFANKPTYVEVVDIINKADNVRQVRALSGLKQN